MGSAERGAAPALLVALCGSLCVASCAGPAPDPARRVRGPLPTKIMQPAGLLFPVPEPRRAAVEAAGSTFVRPKLAYASIFEQRVQSGEVVAFDGELARLALEVRHGLGGGFELAIEPTFLFASSGFLDRIIDDFHELTGFVGGGREAVGRHQYAMELGLDGRTAFSLEEDRVTFGDLPITLTKTLRDEDAHGPAVSARFTVELPTGDEAGGVGSGGVDFAAGLLLERSVGRWSFYGGVDGVEADQPDAFRAARIDVRTLLLASGGVEYRWSDRLSLLGQAVLQMPLTRSLTSEEIDREILDLGFGLAYDLSRGTTLQASFHEDAVAASGPDVTVQFGLVVRF